jgi:hypothetical protein
VRLASKYERQHNKLAGENIQTFFETNVGIPRGEKKQGAFIKQVIQEIMLNPVSSQP